MMEPIRPSVWRRAKRKTAAIEGDEAGGAQEDAIEARPQLAASPRCRRQAILLQVGVEPPDQAADELLSGALPIGERLPLVPQPLGMAPTERVLADVELAGVVADDHRLVAEPVRGDGAPTTHPRWRRGSGQGSPARQRCRAAQGGAARRPGRQNCRWACASNCRITVPDRSCSRMYSSA